LFDIVPLVTVTWSLSYEFAFYLSLPLLMAVTRMRAWSRSARAAFFAFVLVAYIAANGLGYLPHVRFTMFLSGVLIYELAKSRWRNVGLSRRWECCACILYAGTLAAVGVSKASGNITESNFLPVLRTPVVFTLLWIALFAFVRYSITFNGVFSLVLSAAPLRWLGNMSYSYFLIHGLILNGAAVLMERLAPVGVMPAGVFLALLTINLAVTAAGSLVLFGLIEYPFSVRSTMAPRAAMKADQAFPAVSKAATG
jgi:exopolysaccharide production protein ExoZ